MNTFEPLNIVDLKAQVEKQCKRKNKDCLFCDELRNNDGMCGMYFHLGLKRYEPFISTSMGYMCGKREVLPGQMWDIITPQGVGMLRTVIYKKNFGYVFSPAIKLDGCVGRLYANKPKRRRENK